MLYKYFQEHAYPTTTSPVVGRIRCRFSQSLGVSRKSQSFRRVGSRLQAVSAGVMFGCAWKLQFHYVSVLHERSDFTCNISYVLSWAGQCASALAFMHNKFIAYRDLKPEKSASVFFKNIIQCSFLSIDIANNSVSLISTFRDSMAVLFAITSNILLPFLFFLNFCLNVHFFFLPPTVFYAFFS